MIKNTAIAWAFLMATSAIAQQQITLDDCYRAMHTHHPLAKQADLIARNDAIQRAAIAHNYWPQTNLNAQATWQSHVTSLPITLPNIEVPTLNKDQYKATLDVSQPIWDGGITPAQKNLQTATAAAEQARLAVDLYQPKEQIQQAYFGMLLARRQQENLDLLRTDLRAKLSRVQAGIENGTAIKAQALALEVKLLEIKQQEAELNTRKSAAAHTLALLTGLPIDDAATLALPDSNVNTTTNRPEIAMFEAQKSAILAQEDMITAKGMPKISAFAQAGYGRPGLNMLSNAFDPFAIVGARATWSLTQYYTGSGQRDRDQLAINADKISTQKQAFQLATDIRTSQQYAEISRLRDQLATDEDIISLRSRIRTTAEIQLEGGTITTADYIAESTAENMARQQKTLHELQLLQAYQQLRFIAGQ